MWAFIRKINQGEWPCIEGGKKKPYRSGYVHNNPIMSVATLGLPVSPALKLTDKGLVDVKKGEIVPLIVNTKKNK